MMGEEKQARLPDLTPEMLDAISRIPRRAPFKRPEGVLPLITVEERMTPERLAELEALDRGPCLPAVKELCAEVRMLQEELAGLRDFNG